MTYLNPATEADRRFTSVPRSQEEVEFAARIIGGLMAPTDAVEAARVAERFIALQRWRGLTTS